MSEEKEIIVDERRRKMEMLLDMAKTMFPDELIINILVPTKEGEEQDTSLIMSNTDNRTLLNVMNETLRSMMNEYIDHISQEKE